MVTPPVNRNIDQSQTKFASSFFTGRRCHESLFHARIAVGYNLLYNTPNN